MHSTQAPTTPWSSWLSQELIENMPIGVYVCDHDGVLVAYNKHAATIWAATPVLGDTQKKFCGAHRLFLSDGTYVPHDKTPLARVVVDQQPVVFEARVGRPDGTQVHVQANVSPLFDEQGVFVGFVNCVLDITDRKREDAERVRLAEALHQTQKMEALGQLTSGLAHDFNNLLSAISGNLDLALRRIDDPKAIRQLQNAGMAAERGAKLVSQIMAFSRHQQLESQSAQLNGMISDIAAILERTLSGGVMLSVQLSSEDWAVGVDRNQFELAIMNLVLNARDASPDGGTITIRTEVLHAADLPKMLGLQPGDYGRITVSDTGSGIPGDIVAKIFDPFFTTKAIGKGTGLGLSMVRGLLTQLGGTVTVESEVGQGTQFDLYVPRATAAGPIAAVQDLFVPGNGEPVLIVDDDPQLRDVLAETLRVVGYEPVEADSGRQALVMLARDDAPRLMITDNAMPEMSGAELIQQARSLWPGLKIMMVSGDSARGVPVDIPILRKPFHMGALSRELARVLDGPGVG